MLKKYFILNQLMIMKNIKNKKLLNVNNYYQLSWQIVVVSVQLYGCTTWTLTKY